jgi:hypothetical protein
MNINTAYEIAEKIADLVFNRPGGYEFDRAEVAKLIFQGDVTTRVRLLAIADEIQRWRNSEDPYAIELICDIEEELREILDEESDHA